VDQVVQDFAEGIFDRVSAGFDSSFFLQKNGRRHRIKAADFKELNSNLK
jgi:hypothetical protein